VIVGHEQLAQGLAKVMRAPEQPRVRLACGEPTLLEPGAELGGRSQPLPLVFAIHRVNEALHEAKRLWGRLRDVVAWHAPSVVARAPLRHLR
jgi:hypothetical protein